MGRNSVEVTRVEAGAKNASKQAKFYTFSQNNSGGRFHETEDVCEFVVIEAYDVDDANDRAERIGIYFDGCEKERDCDCCGDRWYPQSTFGKDPGTAVPMLYDQTIKEFLEEGKYSMRDKAIVHYIDGSKEVYTATKKT